MTTHTPGPWRVGGNSVTNGVQIFKDSDYPALSEPICTMPRKGVGRSANARLIASAPDLLAALQGLFEHCSMVHKRWGDGSNQREADAAIAAAREAIRKATGG